VLTLIYIVEKSVCLRFDEAMMDGYVHQDFSIGNILPLQKVRSEDPIGERDSRPLRLRVPSERVRVDG
jgi:hypothetical protein